MINLTDQMIYRLGNLNTEQQRISYQMSSGKVLENGSDDSSIFARQLYVDDKIRTYEGLKVQIEKTEAQNTVADSSMSEMKTLLDNIKQEVIKALNPGMDSRDKVASAVNIGGMKENLLTLVNERVNGEYLFAGRDSTTRPFSKDSVSGNIVYNGDDTVKAIAVEPNTYRDKGINGFDVMFYDKDVGSNSDPLEFTLDERILDEDGTEWHLSEATAGHALTFAIGDTIKETTMPAGAIGTVGNVWALSEATVGHKLTFDKDDAIVDNNGNTWTLNPAHPGATEITFGGDSIPITIDLTGAGEIYTTTSTIPNNLGISKLSIGSNPTLREISSGNMPGTSIDVTNVQGDKYVTDVIGASVTGLTTTNGGALTLKHFDSNGTVVSTDTKLAVVTTPEPTDPDTGLTIRQYKLTAIDPNEKFAAKHNIFDDIDLVINALKTDTNDTTGSTVGLRETLSLMDKSYDASNVAHAKLGGRNKIFELASITVTSKLTHFNILSQEVGAVDLGKVAMEAKALEMTFTALYSTITKMNSLSLVNFMR